MLIPYSKDCCDPNPTVLNNQMNAGFIIENKDLVYERALWRVYVLLGDAGL